MSIKASSFARRGKSTHGNSAKSRRRLAFGNGLARAQCVQNQQVVTCRTPRFGAKRVALLMQKAGPGKYRAQKVV